ncbi:actin-related protein, putative [Plasmodium knowlesi strain H]|uniref:Actin-related protein, putative n=3 Tax=Plasmodium knowlesi TaxID=5850 RepID=A0A5K1UFA3_PLAKH|nr:actin-related protein, putative [Plasmodium knowlesi strain H]OTN68431.1 Actin-like protein [Plasmodium knowlesi]CAA9986572.1 actin-related protein, putative [Plasmodium knowlesi strain H]SBO24157.1 actin-related protein, putative [Plasmodium knowlesi strain H]SBO29285.1 actin-related protein, putative [Plasmodium knowlesi strain H]VVS76046.1 actin-related protein, putative [Plasmodium knowlesi strain H]|eukprot:XP_002261113.1 actin-like protein [Plasmodium knowlesi strain H]
MAAPVNIDVPKLILDNGGGLIKGGILPSYSQMKDSQFNEIEPKFIVPNCVGQVRKKNIIHISDSCYSICEYFCHRPHVDGLLMDLEMQTKIWEKIFSCKQSIGFKINDMAICVTESYLTPAYIRQGVIELLFEYFNFNQIIVVSSQTMLPFSFIGLNLGQYDILNPPVFSYRNGRGTKGESCRRGRKGSKCVKGKNHNLKDDINGEGDGDCANNHSYLKNEVDKWPAGELQDDLEEEKEEGGLGICSRSDIFSEVKKEIVELGNGIAQDECTSTPQKNEIPEQDEPPTENNALSNRHIFVRDIECYNKYTHRVYLEERFRGENWQEYHFGRFFNCGDGHIPGNGVVRTLQSNNYMGNSFAVQDPNFLLPDQIDLHNRYYEPNFRDLHNFQSHFNNAYVDSFYSEVLNGNYNLSLRNPCALYVDVGFSHTYVLPYIEYKVIEYAILRTKVSASILNTYLKNVLSYKHVNLEHNELLVENIKERACYVSLDYDQDLQNEKRRLEEVKRQRIADKLGAREELLLKEELAKTNGESHQKEELAKTNGELHEKEEEDFKRQTGEGEDSCENGLLNEVPVEGKVHFGVGHEKRKIKLEEINTSCKDGKNPNVDDITEKNGDKKKKKRTQPHLFYSYKLIDYNNASKREISEVYDTLRTNCSNDCIYVDSDLDDQMEFANYSEGSDIQKVEVSNEKKKLKYDERCHDGSSHKSLHEGDLRRRELPNDLSVKGRHTEAEYKNDIINLTNERIGIPEVLFNPRDINLEHCSIVELIYRCISLLPKEIQRYFVAQIYISGGSTKFKNFKHRLYKELRAIFPSEWEINIYSHRNSLYSNYIGTYVWLSDQNIYKYNVITREQYFNYGRGT